MRLFSSFLRRRQFLIASGMASTYMLTSKKIKDFIHHQDFQNSVTMAADKAATAGMKAAGNECPHLLSPLRIRNVVLKNRIMHTVSPPYLLQGPENFPADAYRNHYSNMARNAAIVTMNTHFGKYPKTYKMDRINGSDYFCDDNWEDIPPVHNYIERLMEDIHCEGALILHAGGTGGGGNIPPDDSFGRGVVPGRVGPQAQAPISIKDIVAQAKQAEDQGYDVYQMNTASLEAIEAVRSSTNLIIMATLKPGGERSEGIKGADTSNYKWNYEGIELDFQFGANTPGITNINQPTASEIEQVVESAKKLVDIADFVWIRDNRHEHPNSWIQDKESPFTLAYAEAIKKAGVKIFVCPSAGFHDPVQNDDYIASGKTDMVGMTTPFFADPDLIKKISAGRADDVLPCIQCHNCHGISRTHGPWYQSCTVNPKFAAPVYKLGSIKAPLETKKVAVIGGGPGGMKAALVAAERGHKVTLYEKDAALGGLLQFSDHSQWRWNHKVFKDWLIYQVNKAGIDVKLSTTATPEMIRTAGFDTVLVATGAEPVISKMPGADADNVFNILTCYSNKKALGKNVVMLGAGRIGTEAALGMAKDGHQVTVMTSGEDLIELEVIGPHNMMNQISIIQNHPNFKCIFKATAKNISVGKVIYTDSKGDKKSILADSVVVYAGLRPRMDEAMKFNDSASEVILLGDCTGKNGTIQKTIRSAFFVASQV